MHFELFLKGLLDSAWLRILFWRWKVYFSQMRKEDMFPNKITDAWDFAWACI